LDSQILYVGHSIYKQDDTTTQLTHQYPAVILNISA